MFVGIGERIECLIKMSLGDLAAGFLNTIGNFLSEQRRETPLQLKSSSTVSLEEDISDE